MTKDGDGGDRVPRGDVEIGAAARAKRIRFREVPETEVRFHGEADGESRSVRRNLPDEVEPGVTYRDVEIGWIASARAEPDEKRADRRQAR